MLTAMLDMETGARGYFETGQLRFLQPWYQGRQEFTAELAASRSMAAGDQPLQALLDQQAAESAAWRGIVTAEIEHVRLGGLAPDERRGGHPEGDGRQLPGAQQALSRRS